MQAYGSTRRSAILASENNSKQLKTPLVHPRHSNTRSLLLIAVNVM